MGSLLVTEIYFSQIWKLEVQGHDCVMALFWVADYCVFTSEKN